MYVVKRKKKPLVYLFLLLLLFFGGGGECLLQNVTTFIKMTFMYIPTPLYHQHNAHIE